jgi:hypothetical protein
MGWTTEIQSQEEAQILLFLTAPLQSPSPSSVLPNRYRVMRGGGGGGGVLWAGGGKVKKPKQAKYLKTENF